jgi:hypothetical protein
MLFRRVRKIAISNYLLRHVCPSVCLSAWNNSALPRRVSMKYSVCGFLKKSMKKNSHQHMHSVCYHIHYKNLLHVSTPPRHLQGEQFLYTMAALI